MRWWLIALGVAAVAGAAIWRWTGTDADTDALPVPGSVIKLEVEVLNATAIDGLARRVTRLLRHRGIDVVSYGSAEAGSVESTTLIVRRGDSASVQPLLDALGVGHIILEPSDRRLLDVSVLLGPDAADLGRDP